MEQFTHPTPSDKGRGIRVLANVNPGEAMMKSVAPLIAVNTNVDANVWDSTAFYDGENNNVASNLPSVIVSALLAMPQGDFDRFRELNGRSDSPNDNGLARGSVKDIHRFERNAWDYIAPHPNDNNRMVQHVVIYYWPSFVNHSCKANAIGQISDNGNMFVTAIRHIEAGTEIEFDYIGDHWLHTFKQRNTHLR